MVGMATPRNFTHILRLWVEGKFEREIHIYIYIWVRIKREKERVPAPTQGLYFHNLPLCRFWIMRLRSSSASSLPLWLPLTYIPPGHPIPPFPEPSIRLFARNRFHVFGRSVFVLCTFCIRVLCSTVHFHSVTWFCKTRPITISALGRDSWTLWTIRVNSYCD